nr:LppA family lipoprotein [Kibdelosporangium sp. MJ126-NF4]CEL19215.1 hypothetical protein [Kibdelosporangium sp. MJ126-NF4]CTQ94985.1 hypothetical protein [Kibdelosporangium sp. MJ126-NF4]
MKSQFAELRKRPDIETAAQRYEEMRAKIRTRLTTAELATGWVEEKDSSDAMGCQSSSTPSWSEINSSTGEVRYLPRWISAGNLPDDKWDRAVSVVAEIAREYGFDGPGVVINRPSDHAVIFQDDYGAQIHFGTVKNTVFALTTGCHLTVAAHQQGTPQPNPTTVAPGTYPMTTRATTPPPPSTPS